MKRLFALSITLLISSSAFAILPKDELEELDRFLRMYRKNVNTLLVCFDDVKKLKQRRPLPAFYPLDHCLKVCADMMSVGGPFQEMAWRNGFVCSDLEADRPPRMKGHDVLAPGRTQEP